MLDAPPAGHPVASRPAGGHERLGRRRAAVAVGVLLAAALLVRLAFVVATPGYELVHDARDYDRHAVSIAQGQGYPYALEPGRPTAFRPPAYPYFLAAVYELTGVEEAEPSERIEVARIAMALVGVAIVGLLGLVAAQLWGRVVSLVAMALASVYIPLILVGGAVMSEPLFAVLLLGALAAALRHRRSASRYRFAVLAGALAGLTVLSRANALVLLAPLAWAVWDARPGTSWRSLGPPVALVVAALVVVSPWTIRNAVVFDTFIPVSTQLGSALIGTYNDAARTDPENPASWRNLRRAPEYRHLYGELTATSEPEAERRLRDEALRYIGDHPLYVAEVGFWNTVRMLDLAGLAWSRHTTSTIGVAESEWADAGVVCFWLFAVVALAGCLTKAARRAPGFVWAIPLLLYLSVVFLVVETPRYRTGIDLFLVLLAALALTAAAQRRRVRG